MWPSIWLTPISGLFQQKARALAVSTPTNNDVIKPGPTVTAITSRTTPCPLPSTSAGRIGKEGVNFGSPSRIRVKVGAFWDRREGFIFPLLFEEGVGGGWSLR